MGGVTLARLLAVEAAPFHAAAEAWRRLAGALDDAAEVLIRGTRDLSEAWSGGTAAPAAQARTNALCTEVSNCYNPARRIYDALDGHAYAVAQLRSQAEQIIAAARGDGLVVDPAAGSVTAAPSDYQGGNLDHTMRLINSVVAQLEDVLGRARALDDSTADAIATSLPAVETGFGLLPAPPVPREVVAGQRGRHPDDVKEWWDGLTPAQQEQVTADFPELVGWFDGVPVKDRDRANRINLARQEQALEEEQRALDERAADIRRLRDERRWQELWDRYGDNPEAELNRIAARKAENDAKLRGLDAIDQRLSSTDPGRLPVYLMGLSTDGDGRAIVAMGDPDTADNVLTYVPGTGSDLAGAAGAMNRADTMAQDANAWDPGARTAAVMWLGYDAPDTVLDAAGSGYADGAVADLSRFQTGLRATHEGTASHNTILGHSYGTTVIGHTAAQQSVAADEVVFVASPGVGVNNVEDLHGITAEHVWSTRADGDPIHWVPDIDLAHGNDPTREDFGARVFTSDPGGHSSYWDDGNVARDNISRIVTGAGVAR